MNLALTIAFIVAMVALRLLIAPVPGLLKMGVDRWGKRSTFMLCAISLIGAVLVITLTRR